ncbi:MAG: M23 family metallopeptidase [Nitrosomonadales bacterium]|nr:M23 family metallopeptidase [Nitrosomonadales bacterium]MBT7689475.1 M23 family metallopeptidase [Nitrosomonadales bacterium]
MKILFLNKNARKPKSLSFYSLIVLVSIIFSIGFICAYIIFNTQENKDEMSIAPLVLEQEIKVAPTNQEVDLYISQIGELNARIIQLDAQSERIQEIMRGQILGKDKLPKLKEKKDKNVGGPFVNDNLSLGDIHKVLTHLLEKVEKREIFYNKKEALLLKHSVLKETLPTLYPVEVPFNSSSFGWRRDPFLGIRAFHAGLDFSAAQGEEIKSTGAGMVTMVAKDKSYGNFLKIKHGDGLETRYAHCSKILVKKGDIIEKNQVVALVGNTGRSTGPHLHYEIRLHGRALDPRQYLKK